MKKSSKKADKPIKETEVKLENNKVEEKVSTDSTSEPKGSEDPEKVETDEEKPKKAPDEKEPEKVDESEDSEESGEETAADSDDDKVKEEDSDKDDEEDLEETGKSEVEESSDNPDKGKKKKNLIGWISAILMSIGLSLAPMWGVLDKFNTHFVGGGELEGWLWRYWWMKKLLTSVWAQSPKDWPFISYMYFCAGNYPETGNVFDLQTFNLMLEPIFGDPGYYNMKIILILILNGIAGYALCKYLTKSPVISLLGAAVLVVNPYVLYEIANGRPRQAMLFSMPLYAMYVIENYRNLTLKSALLAGFWLGMTAAIYLFYGMAALFFGLIFLFVKILSDRKNFSFTFIKYVVLMLIVFILVSGPFSYRYVEMVIKGEELPETTYKREFPPVEFFQKRMNEIDPRDPWQQSMMRYKTGSLPADFMILPSYLVNVPLVISILVLLPMFFVKPRPWLWIVTLIFFYLLTLGPYLKFGPGVPTYVKLMSGKAVPLPYTVFFKYVPFFSRLFAPLRMLGFFYVALSALIAINVKAIFDFLGEKLKKFKIVSNPALRWAFVVVVITAMVWQMAWAKQLPLNLTKVDPPAIYTKLKNIEGRFGIVEVPFRTGDFTNFYQMYHDKKLLWGWTYGSIPGNFPESYARYLATPNFTEDNTFVRYLESLNRDPDKPESFQPYDLEALRDAGYKYVIVHERGCSDINPEQGGVLYDKIVEELTETIGPPFEMGTETSLWKIRMILGANPTFRIAVFKIP